MNRAPFPYPGSKARHADWILEHIPEHRTYVEPFGGAGGVLFAKPPSKVEVYNDRDGDIVQFFEVLRDRCDELVEWLEAVPFARDVYDEWAEAFYHEDYRPGDPIERAGRFFALRYMQFGGRADAVGGFRAPTSGTETSMFVNKIAHLENFQERLRGVCIENLDWVDLFEKYDSPDTVFYCDPPYFDDSQHRDYYSHKLDHRHLHDKLLEADGRVVLSLSTVPPFYGDGWNVVQKSTKYAIGNGGDADGDGGRDASEVLLMNFDADGTPIMSDVGQQDLEAFCD